MHISDLARVMEQIAPTAEAEPWDNVGLLIGDPAAAVERVLLCIDLTPSVVDEARRQRCEAVVAYHPPIFKPSKRLLAGEVVYEAIRHGIAVYSPHTALDVADGGTNDVLADALYLTKRQPLKLASPGEDLKLITFVPADPPEVLEKVAAALFEAGAGRIGEYRECSFRTEGMGTFYGEEGTDPAVGQKGQREQVREVRLETVVPAGKAEAVIEALRESHPYEEPAFDLLKRALPPRQVGLGRIGRFEEPVPREVLVGRIKRELGIDHVLLAGPMDGRVSCVAVCAGSCGELLDIAAARGAEFYLTGELKHHDALRASKLGLTVACVLHSNSERATLSRLRERLGELLPGVGVMVSEVDADPFRVV